jgi:hypothetical protein
VFNAILKAEDAFHQGDDDRAETLLRQVQERDPKIYVIPFLLGESALRRESWERAADQLQRCLDINPNFDNAMTGLARALAKLGRVAEAKRWLQKRCKAIRRITALGTKLACWKPGTTGPQRCFRTRGRLPSSPTTRRGSGNWSWRCFSRRTMLPQPAIWRKP